MIQKLSGIVIRETKVNEADKILTVLTKEIGTISVSAKNVRKSKSRISAGAGFMCYSDFILSGGPDMFYINQCSLIESFFGISCDIQKLSLAVYLGYITQKMAPQGVNQEETVRLLLNTLYTIENSGKDLNIIKSVYELRLACLQGYMPDMSVCSHCKRLSFPCYFDMRTSKILCCKCGKTSYEISEKLFSVLRFIIFSDEKKIFSFTLSDKLSASLKRISEDYMVFLLGFCPESLKYYNSLDT